ncbi:MAG: hypothetical protein R6T93_03320 [Trueperaceae bacterium]
MPDRVPQGTSIVHERSGRDGRRGRPRARRALATILAAALPAVLSSCVLAEYVLGIRDGCTEYTRAVDFAASSEILRGTWQGTVGDYPAEGVDSTLTLDLTANYGDAKTYTVSGTFTLGAEEALALTGGVHGGCGERYAAGVASAAGPAVVGGDAVVPSSAPPPVGLSADIRDASGALVWTAQAQWRYPGGTGLETDAFELVLESAFDVWEGDPGFRYVAMSRVVP